MSEESQGAMLWPPVSDRRDHIQGSHSAAVTLVEYGDYECPYCNQAFFILRDLMKEFDGRVRLVFRNFPLSQMHPHAERAAEAAEAAGAQGRFWEMHDLLYERREALEDDDLLSYATALGLDSGRFEVEMTQGTYRDRVHEDFLGGVRSGVNGTPTFFINGRRHDGPWDRQALADAVNRAGRRHGGRIERPEYPPSRYGTP